MANAPEHALQENTLAHLVSRSNACWLRPQAFFVSWQGVLTLAYTGFPPPLQELKEKLNQEHTELPKENPGSKWPKTSLGALRDGTRLTPQELQTLNSLCRSLEHVVNCQNISLRDSSDETHPSQAEQDNVAAVLKEADHPDYWFSASKDGNRESHYRGTALGATLVAKVNSNTMYTSCKRDGLMQRILQAFRDAVDEALPGFYAWFEDESLHVTIRALTG